nr:thioredoxin-like domain-containing protein [Coralloluteibacterium stylophorae]
MARGLAFVLALPCAAIHAQQPGLRDAIANALVVPTEHGFEAFAWEQEPEIVALYFGADWCGPCHAFVPELRRIRAALRDAGADTEVVYVSLDESEPEMRRYMRLQRMPWPAVDFRRLRVLPAVTRLAGPAPPNLVVLDRDGRVLASGWQGRRYLGLEPVLRTWIDALGTSAPDVASPPSPPLPVPLQETRR